MPLHFSALKTKSTISHSGERFRDGQYNFVSFLFAVLLLTIPHVRAQPFVKVGHVRSPVPHGVGATARLLLMHLSYTNSETKLRP